MSQNLFKLLQFSDEEHVTFYPTYGYKEGAQWKIPLRLWVHEPRPLVENVITKVAASFGNLDPYELSNFKSRIADLSLMMNPVKTLSSNLQMTWMMKLIVYKRLMAVIPRAI